MVESQKYYAEGGGGKAATKGSAYCMTPFI